MNSTPKAAFNNPLPHHIDRETAAEINPLIGLIPSDTLNYTAQTINDLSYFLSLVHRPLAGEEPHFGCMYLLFDPIVAALRYEANCLEVSKNNEIY